MSLTVKTRISETLRSENGKIFLAGTACAGAILSDVIPVVRHIPRLIGFSPGEFALATVISTISFIAIQRLFPDIAAPVNAESGQEDGQEADLPLGPNAILPNAPVSFPGFGLLSGAAQRYINTPTTIKICALVGSLLGLMPQTFSPQTAIALAAYGSITIALIDLCFKPSSSPPTQEEQESARQLEALRRANRASPPQSARPSHGLAPMPSSSAPAFPKTNQPSRSQPDPRFLVQGDDRLPVQGDDRLPMVLSKDMGMLLDDFAQHVTEGPFQDSLATSGGKQLRLAPHRDIMSQQQKTTYQTACDCLEQRRTQSCLSLSIPTRLSQNETENLTRLATIVMHQSSLLNTDRQTLVSLQETVRRTYSRMSAEQQTMFDQVNQRLNLHLEKC
ncbi:MAG: hypothetical protein HY861_03505 [Chlamydiia bacterium]|nr:hypothetical protein [Chlamydiia bacterium]